MKDNHNGTTFRVHRLTSNMGHATARQKALEMASHDWEAFMDSDDLSLPDRFQSQMSFLVSHSHISVLSGQINEFVGSPDNVVASRQVPLSNNEIYDYARKRCPMNMVATVVKRSDILSVGGFIDWYCEEDYYLWLRIMQAGFAFANMPDVLVNVRVGNDMYRRRGGWRYFKSEFRLQCYMLRHQIISLPRFLINSTMRLVGEFLAPNVLRGFLFKLMRSQPMSSGQVSPSQQSDHPLSERSPRQSPHQADQPPFYDASSDLTTLPPFSLAISVYKGDNPDHFESALHSVLINQSLLPNEVILIVDGPVPPSIDHVIDHYQSLFNESSNHIK